MAQELSRYHQLRIRSRLDPTVQGRALNFDDENDPARTADCVICENVPPGGSARPPPSASANGTPPPPPGCTPPPNQPRIMISVQERDANGRPLFSTPMDNVITSRDAVDNINVTGEGAL